MSAIRVDAARICAHHDVASPIAPSIYFEDNSMVMSADADNAKGAYHCRYSCHRDRLPASVTKSIDGAA